jgi:heme-degrading monooxygenase HmoA
MYARIERINLSQGFAELAEQLVDQIAPIMRRQPGMQAITLLSDETSGEYIVLTHWDTLEQVNTYERSPDEWRVRDIMSQHLTAVPVIEVYQVHTLSAAPTAEPTASAASGTS